MVGRLTYPPVIEKILLGLLSASRDVSNAVCQSKDIAVTGASLLTAVNAIAFVILRSLRWLARRAAPHYIPAQGGQ